jgi:hypothetical protein
MNPRAPIPPQLLEALSAYLDGRLEGPEKAALEALLNKEEGLRRELEELRSVRDSLRALPMLKPPRSLSLTHDLVGQTARKTAAFTPRRMALGSALVSLALAVVLAADLFSRGAFRSAAPAPQALMANAPAVPAESADQAGKSAGGMETSQSPEATASPRINRACDDCTSPPPELTFVPSPTIEPALGGGCGGCNPTAELSAIPPSATGQAVEATPLPRSLPGFLSFAPFLEALFGLAAVLLAALAAAAVLIRRRR